MCLAIPGKIIEKTGDKVVVDYGSEKRSAIDILDVNLGDYVIISGGFVVTTVSEEEAEKMIGLIIEGK